MKRHLTLTLKQIQYDYNIKPTKDLDKRVGKDVKILGDIIVGKPLEFHFEDGYIFRTKGLDLNGFINEYERVDGDPNNQRLNQIVVCTKDISFIFGISDNDFKLNTEEQLSLF